MGIIACLNFLLTRGLSPCAILKVIKYLGDNIFLYNFAYIQC